MGVFTFLSTLTSSSPRTTTTSTAAAAARPIMTPKQLVEETINNNDIVIFSKSWCPHSHKAKTLGSQIAGNKSLKVLELDELDDGADVQAYLAEKTGQRTVPNVFIHQQHIGGNDDFQAAYRSGRVKQILSSQQ